MGPDSSRPSSPAGLLLDASTTCQHSASGVDRVLAHYGVADGAGWSYPVSAKSGLALTETLGAADVEVDPDNQSLGEP